MKILVLLAMSLQWGLWPVSLRCHGNGHTRCKLINWKKEIIYVLISFNVNVYLSTEAFCFFLYCYIFSSSFIFRRFHKTCLLRLTKKGKKPFTVSLVHWLIHIKHWYCSMIGIMYITLNVTQDISLGIKKA